MINPVDVPGKCHRFVSILAADGGKSLHGGPCPRRCQSPPDLPGDPRLSRKYPGSQGPSWGQTTSASLRNCEKREQREKREAGEVIICVEVLPRALRGGVGGIRWLEKGSVLSDQMCWLRKTNC